MRRLEEFLTDQQGPWATFSNALGVRAHLGWQFLAGVGALTAITLLTYLPAQRIGYFYAEDYSYLLFTSKLSFIDALAQFWDPRAQTIWYRPVHGLLLWVVNTLLGPSDNLYHLWVIIFHLANGFLIWLLVRRTTGRSRMAFLAALFFSALPSYGASVWWPLDSAPLAGTFFLLTLLFWFEYLQSPRHLALYTLALGTYAVALLSKETSVILILILILLDRLVVKGQTSLATLIYRYVAFGLLLIAYLAAELTFQSHGLFVTTFGFSAGTHIVRHVIDYLGILASPWQAKPISVVWTAFCVLLLLLLARKTRHSGLVFLLASIPVALLPVLPVHGLEHRHLYLPAMAVSILLAALIDLAYGRLRPIWISAGLVSAATASFVLLGMSQNITVVQGLADAAGPPRTFFRALAQKYPRPPENSLVYVLDPPYPVESLAGMAYLRFGDRVALQTNAAGAPAQLRDHSFSAVMYRDEDGAPRYQIAGEPDTTTVIPPLPSQLEIPVRLVGLEVVNTAVRQGDDIVVLLYWTADQKLDKEYTVFAHLTNGEGNVVAGSDGQPGGGRKSTPAWNVDELIVDWRVVPVDPDVPPGNAYFLEVGMYYLPTMEQLGVLAPDGTRLDSVRIGPLEIIRRD